MENIEIVRDFYDQEVLHEWERIAGRPEFLLTCRFLDRYIRPGDRVLDIGGGPGRYSLYLARKGCEVTLLDLSPENVRFAGEEAGRQGLSLTALSGDARFAGELVRGPFDHVLLMGPLYHLLEESDREQAVRAALGLLKPGGLFYASFINLFADVIYYMSRMPEGIGGSYQDGIPALLLAEKGFSGPAFTKAYFAHQKEILPFMEKFPLEKLHFFGQEGIMSPCEKGIMAQSQEVIGQWLDLSEALCEREEYLSWAEHLMYIGRKISPAV